MLNKLGIKLFVKIRSIIFPFEKIIKYFPKNGVVLDVGCGHGTLSILLAKNLPESKFVGIDPSIQKIKNAKHLSKGLSNIKFRCAYLKQVNKQKFDAIAIVDVACLMPPNEIIKLLLEAKKRLNKKGILILKEVEKTNSAFYYFMLFEEFLMAKVFHLTFTNHTKTYLLSRSQYKELLHKAGFKIKTIKAIRGPLPYPHVLFICN